MAKDIFQKRDGKTISEVAENQVICLICKFGLEPAEKLIGLMQNKIRAKKNALNHKEENGL